MRRHATIPYVAPFLVFIGLLALQQAVRVPAWLRLAISMAAILAFSRAPLRGGPSKSLPSILIGTGVFLIWITPDEIALW